MYKILFTSALSQELKTVKSEIKTLNNKVKIDFFATGIGNYKTILNLTKHLSKNDYDFIINIGICGFTDNKEPFQVARILNISNNKELLIPIPFKFLNLESIANSEKIIYDKKDLQDEKYIDMESYGFELVCNDFFVPRIILKTPFDQVGSKETTHFEKDLALEKLKQIDYNKLIDEIVSFLNKYKKETIDFERYYAHYKLTFAEKLIFQKIYFRYTSLTGNNFDSFFNKNCSLNKKEFLKLGLEIEND